MSTDFKDKLRQPLYDTIRYSPGMYRQLMFSVPIGQGTGIFGGAKTTLDTNMVLAGQMPCGWEFQATGIGVEVFTTGEASAADLLRSRRAVIESGTLTLQIGCKKFTELPLSLPAGSRLRPGLSAHLADGAMPGTAEAVALLDRLSRVWSSEEWSRAADALTDLVAGPVGFPFEKGCELVLVPTQYFGVDLQFYGTPKVSAPMAVRVLLYGKMYRPVQ